MSWDAWGGAWGGGEAPSSSGFPSQQGGGGSRWGIYGRHASRLWEPIFPPLPTLIIMTDRDDGVEYFLSHTADGEHVSLTSGQRPPRHGRENRTGTDGGPYLFRRPDIYLRLFVRGGHLGYEQLADLSVVYNSPPVITRLGMQRGFKQLTIPTTWVVDGRLAFEAV